MGDSETVRTVDRLVDHVSTVPAIRGEHVQLFLREKIADRCLDSGGQVAGDSVVLMVHGGFWPSTVAFDLDLAGYSWMEYLARAGLDVFAVDMTGYGYSSRPMMDDPANLSPDDRAHLGARRAAGLPPAPYPYRLVDSNSETDDLLRVVDFIRNLRGIDRIHLIGWSGGGIRVGTFARRHADRVARLVIWASSNYANDGPDAAPALPAPGHPVQFQTRATGEGGRWFPNLRYPGQVEPGVPEIVWHQSMLTDPVGARWGPGGLRGPGRSYWGWNAKGASRVKAPTLVMVGNCDRLSVSNRRLFENLGSKEKSFLEIEGGSHFMAWECQRYFLHRASLDWIRGKGPGSGGQGTFRADYEGHISPMDI